MFPAAPGPPPARLLARPLIGTGWFMTDHPRNLLGLPDVPALTGRQQALAFPVPSAVALDDERQALAWAAKRDHETIPMFPEPLTVKGYKMETKFTPGPWRVAKHGEVVADAFNSRGLPIVLSVAAAGLSDVALIAAAPDLLAALEAAVERMEAVAAGIGVENRANGISQATHVRHMAGHLAQHAKIARAAIAKAKGE